MTVATNAGEAVACVRQAYKEIVSASSRKSGETTAVELGEGTST